jgi:hypothetical protein
MRSRDTRVASFPFVLQQSAENRWARTPGNCTQSNFCSLPLRRLFE